MNKVIYADNAATTELKNSALVAMIPFMTYAYGNPSAVYSKGREALEAIWEARETIAECIGAEPREIIFTSGGTESDNQAWQSAVMQGFFKKKMGFITSSIEHHAVLNTAKRLKRNGYSVNYLAVNEEGVVDPKDVEVAANDQTMMASIMMANNEIGTIEPIKEIGNICREKGIIFHTDAVQAVGHIPINVKELNIDMLSMSAHKFGGPKGVGALYVRRGCPVRALIEGGGQENGLRSGTENVAGIVGMAAALRDSCEHMAENTVKVVRMRDCLISGLRRALKRMEVTGSMTNRVPGTASFCFEGIEGSALVLRLDAEGICASAGSACTTGTLEPSHVLEAIGVPESMVRGSLRISLDEKNTMDDVEKITQTIIQNVEALRAMSPRRV